MGIELPADLAAIAARTGVKWPAADEDKMREVAQAWRDTGQKITTLISEADTAARTALGTTEGAGADAARQHWGKFVQPDTGHLTRIARGCAAAADKLDHAANQIGQAKVAIVRELTPLAKNVDVAEHAARAGDPTALLGLDTAIRGAAANLANVHSTLVTAVQPASGVVMDSVEPIVNTSPGGYGTPVSGVVNPGGQGPLAPVADAVGGVVDAAYGGGPSSPVHDGANAGGKGPLGPIADTVGGVVNPGGHGPGVLPPVAQPVVDGVSGVVPGGPGGGTGSGVGVGHGGGPQILPIGDGPGPGPGFPPGGGHGPGGPDTGGGHHGPPAITLPEPATGPLPIIDRDVPTPPTGFHRPDHGVQIAGAAAVLDAPPPTQAPAQPAAPAAPAAPINQPPAAGTPFVGGGAPPPPPPPVAAAPGPAAPAAPPPAAAAQPGIPAQQQVQRPAGVVPIAVTAEPARPQAPQPVPMAAPAKPDQEQESVVAIWLVRMFPIGHMPVATDRPARQLPPPKAEFDYAAGMRFEPNDHPDSDLIDDAEALAWALEGGDAVVSGPSAPVGGLTSGHDPLAGQNERDWARRFVVRAGSGRDTLDTEYAWPPAELFPEGATAPGEPETLEPGTVVDRFGSPEGRVFATAETPFAQRSLPPSHVYAEYRRYRVLKPLPVWRGISAAWFGQNGGGVRYRTTHPALDLIALGYLAEETNHES